METIKIEDFKKDNLFKLLTLFQSRESHATGFINMVYVEINSYNDTFSLVATDLHVLIKCTFPLKEYLTFLLSLKSHRPYINVKNLNDEKPENMVVQVNISQLNNTEPLIIGGKYPNYDRVIPKNEDTINHPTKFAFIVHETMKKAYKLLNFKNVQGWNPDYQTNAEMPAITKPYENVLILTMSLRV